jgi:hypothetical protein
LAPVRRGFFLSRSLPPGAGASVFLRSEAASSRYISNSTSDEIFLKGSQFSASAALIWSASVRHFLSAVAGRIFWAIVATPAAVWSAAQRPLSDAMRPSQMEATSGKKQPIWDCCGQVESFLACPPSPTQQKSGRPVPHVKMRYAKCVRGRRGISRRTGPSCWLQMEAPSGKRQPIWDCCDQ